LASSLSAGEPLLYLFQVFFCFSPFNPSTSTISAQLHRNGSNQCFKPIPASPYFTLRQFENLNLQDKVNQTLGLPESHQTRTESHVKGYVNSLWRVHP